MPQDYSKYLRDGETLEDVSIGTLRKRKHDDDKRNSRIVPTADEWRDDFPKKHPEQNEKATEYVVDFKSEVEKELQRSISYDEEYTVDLVARTLIALQRNWVRKVVDPSGDLVLGSYFPEAVGSDIIFGAKKYGLKQSETFSKAYKELLETLDRRYGKERTQHASDIRQELDTYKPQEEQQHERTAGI
jgi:hypothetical protein